LTFSAFAEGFLQKNDVPLESLALGTAAISPSSGTVQNGNEFTVEIIAYPSISTLQEGSNKFNNYELLLYYDANYIDFVSVENLVDGLDVDKESATTGMVTFAVSKPFGAFYQNQPTRLAKMTFLAKKAVTNNEITLYKLSIINSLGDKGNNAELITTINNGLITITDSGGSGGSGGSSCYSNCDNKQCGTDGCGKSCGSCPEGQLCKNDQCVCVPNCLGKECGDDGCGNSCGTCSGDLVCQSKKLTSTCVSKDVLEEYEKSLEEETKKRTESPSSTGSIFWIIFGAVFIIAALVLFYFLIWKKKNKGGETPPMNNQQQGPVS
ncbi:MAG: cohesin domain-containing protein, partial [Nanoarchaeota archaeon]